MILAEIEINTEDAFDNLSSMKQADFAVYAFDNLSSMEQADFAVYVFDNLSEFNRKILLSYIEVNYPDSIQFIKEH